MFFRLTKNLDAKAGAVLCGFFVAAGLTAAPARLAIGFGLASAVQPRPAYVELWSAAGQIASTNAAYTSCRAVSGGLVGRVTIRGPEDSRFEFYDRWTWEGSLLHLTRSVKVSGHAPGGFLSGVTFDFLHPTSWAEADWFAPGILYGGAAGLSPAAIGGVAPDRAGDLALRIREDRLPAPLLLAHFADGASLAVLDPAPRGDTTRLDSWDAEGAPMVDDHFQFGAIGAQEHGGRLSLGYWFPGSEGEVTYAGGTYPSGQLHQWRRRYHPIKDGLVQQYKLTFRSFTNGSFSPLCATAWRWAWETLRPQVAPQDIPAARRSSADVLSRCVVEKEGRAGIPNYLDAVTKDLAQADEKAVMGFAGKCLAAANDLLQEADLDPTARGVRMRRQAEAIIASFLRLKVAPPEGEGFSLKDGFSVCAIGSREIFLRSFGDDVTALLQAYQREESKGRYHAEWLKWCKEFGDWLLSQQQPGGGFPRSWKPGTGEVVSASPNSSYNAVRLLVRLHQVTQQSNYLAAAVRAADFCWSNGQAQGRFVGGTIDNPDVVDKEAGALSLGAYLALYETTQDPRWLRRAKAAAAYAETWIYLWNVPMPPDEDNAKLHWKRGVPTVGLQLIATGHSLVDEYMSCDAGEYARLYQYTGDRHDLAVARILLFDTKNMLALPGRVFDLGEPGWQQEHWSLAPRRGYGLHRGWLPWVATSQLDGIFGVMNLRPEIRSEVLNPTGL